MTRSNLDGKTLMEKRSGAGARPDLLHYEVVTFQRCVVEGCESPNTCTMEWYVDDAPPTVDWLTRVLSRMFDRYGRAWVTMPFCTGHGVAAMEYGLEYLEDPDLWAPGRESPAAFPHPLKIRSDELELITARG